jgi:hypothetical protein
MSRHRAHAFFRSGRNRKRAARLMTVAGIEGIPRRRRGKKRTRLAAGDVAPDQSGGTSSPTAPISRPPRGCVAAIIAAYASLKHKHLGASSCLIG